MHRVYNSAFMHMLRDEDDAGYRQVIKDTLEFDPEILKRYVNFMSNPDEKTAVEQFGKGDKYFGVATVLATLPGLPMLGHGQVEGFGEKYGMEFRRATLDEQPDPWLVARHEREIFPLLHRRAWFAEAHDFLLYDFVTDGGAVDEDVFAYSNGVGPTALARRLPRPVRLDHAAGSASRRPYARQGRRRRQAAGPPVARRGPRPAERPGGVRRLPRRPDGPRVPPLVPRDLGARAASCRSTPTRATCSGSSARSGTASAGQWARLAARLGGRGVPSLDDALRELQLEPVHGPLRAIFADGLDGRASSTASATRSRARRARAPVRGVPAPRSPRRPASTAMPTAGRRPVRGRRRIARRPGARRGVGDRARDSTDSARRSIGDGALLVWLALSRIGRAGARVPTSPPRAAPGTTSCGCPARSRPACATSGFDEGEAWAVADRVRVLLALPRPSTHRGARLARRRPRLLEALAGARRRSGPRSGSTPGRASSTSTATGSRTSSAGRPARRDRRRTAPAADGCLVGR